MIELFVYKSALKEYMRFRRVILWILVGIGAGALAVAWRRGLRAEGVDDIYAQVSEILVFRVLALMSAIHTSAIISQEVEQKTIVYLLTRPIQRWQILLPRYLASVTAVAVISIFSAGCVAVGAYGGDGLSEKLFWQDITAILLGAFAYGSFFLFIGLLINRAMLFNMLFIFGWETATTNMPGDVFYISIFSYMKAIAEHPATGAGGLSGLLAGAMGLSTISKSTAIGVLVLVTICFAALSAWWFTNFEYVPREDAA